ncbi:MAG TPA: enoyl-CoA hydratase/isomerase family protein [Kofleriaceae bacterium]|nr:enoyl-CoA hydratase/isomerase family protein [Kofleriaceae bacterium]
MAAMRSEGEAEVATIRLEGGKANAMTSDLLDTIERAIDEFERSPARAAVLTGYDRFFSAGLALPKLVGLDRPAMHVFIERFGRTMMRVFACEKPVIAAINGHAIAGGCVLALMCDWRVFVDEPGARIGLNEVQLGIGLPAIVVEPLRCSVPATSLVPIALEGRLFSPVEALAIGLVHAVSPAAELADRAHAKAAELAALPPLAVTQIKRALRGPIIDAVARTQAVETERWLDSWFAPDARARLEAAVSSWGQAPLDQPGGVQPREIR